MIEFSDIPEDAQRPKLQRNRLTRAGYAALDEAIIAAVEQDRPLTVRAAYYRVLSAGVVTKSDRSYDQVQGRLVKLRETGRVSYTDIIDGTRSLTGGDGGYDSPADYIQRVLDPERYFRSMWETQPKTVIVISEKDAMAQIIGSVTGPRYVELGIVRGYGSVSFAWRLAQQIGREHKPVVVFQVGDHDPSGVGAWEDFQGRMTQWAPDADIRFERIAVTPEQIIEMDLPTRPTSTKDSRGPAFMERFRDIRNGESVEVDAIPGNTVRALLAEAIDAEIDHDAWAAAEQRQADERVELGEMIARMTA